MDNYIIQNINMITFDGVCLEFVCGTSTESRLRQELYFKIRFN